jgi:uncharacterized protein (TIGR03437 family)
VTIAGVALGPISPVSARLDNEGKLPLELAGVRVFLDGQSIPLVSVQYGLVTVSVPETLAGNLLTVQVESNGQRTAPAQVEITPTWFYVFTLDGSGKGPAAAINQDGSINSPDHTAKTGSVVSVFGTGASVKTPIKVWVNYQPAEVQYAGQAPGLVPGVMQVNFRVPITTSGTALISVFAGQSSRPFVFQQDIPSPTTTVEIGN